MAAEDFISNKVRGNIDNKVQDLGDFMNKTYEYIIKRNENIKQNKAK